MRLLIGDQEWRADAQCRKEGVPTERFFPWRGESQTAAKECCSRCPVRQECYDFAVENDERGIFGGVLFSR
ncbi:MAG: WhiB family transcriptional regulator [Rhodothermales bacterium]|nr:WhiB family transcriptional regulator [Rhodothermales bacterium]